MRGVHFGFFFIHDLTMFSTLRFLRKALSLLGSHSPIVLFGLKVRSPPFHYPLTPPSQHLLFFWKTDFLGVLLFWMEKSHTLPPNKGIFFSISVVVVRPFMVFCHENFPNPQCVRKSVFGTPLPQCCFPFVPRAPPEFLQRR